MNRLRLSGSARPDTCSADTVVPRMTNRSTPASTTCFQYCWVRCGERAPATVTPARRTSCRRSVISSGMIGAALARASEAPGAGWHWGSEAHHPQLPRGERVEVGTAGSLEEILFGPGRQADGTLNLVGALRRALATTGYSDLKEFQRVEVVVSPYQPR